MSTYSRRTLVALSLVLAFGACGTSNDTSPGSNKASGGSVGAAGASGDPGVGGDVGVSGAAGESTSGGDPSAAGSATTPSTAGTGTVSAGAGGVGIAGAAGSGTGPATAGSTSTCAPIVNPVTAVPPILMFQIDITGSMGLPTSTTNGISKWEATKTAFASALTRLPWDWIVGVTFFNRMGSSYSAEQEVIVPLAPMDQTHIAEINNAIEYQTPSGGTPTFCAWDAAAKMVSAYTPPVDSVYAQSQRFVVLMTDGVPTVDRDCKTLGSSPGGNNSITQDEYNYFASAVKDTTEKTGLRTFVIGVPGSDDPQGATYDPRCMLSELAEAGGTALPAECTSTVGVGACTPTDPGSYCHMDLTTSADFAHSLEDVIVNRIAHSVVSCDYPIPAVRSDVYVDAKHTSVLYAASESAAPQTLTLATTAACADGDYFFVTDTRGRVTTVTMCPKKCQEMQGNPNGQLKVQFVCITVG
jgi:hypothetical protein